MGFLTSLFGGTGNPTVTVILGLAIVLVLIVLGVWALKLLFNASANMSRGRNRRLSVIDTTPVDQKRRLVLIRRDNVEHLLLLGGAHDLVVETGIEPPVAQEPRRRTRVTADDKPGQRPDPSEPTPQRPTPTPYPPQPRPVPPEPTPEHEKIVAQTSLAEADEISVAPEQNSNLAALSRLAETDRPGSSKRYPSLRYTGLLKTEPRAEPEIIPSLDSKSPDQPDDSANDEFETADEGHIDMQSETDSDAAGDTGDTNNDEHREKGASPQGS